MNELQIKITADIKDIQTALTSVKKTLKQFEDSMASSTDKTNKKMSDQKGIIQRLNADVAKYKTLITKATSEAQIAKYNKKLQDTQKEIARLNALGKVFEKTNVKVQEEIGLIGILNAKLKELRIALRNATNEDEITRVNIELEKTSAELARINSLGKTVGTTTSQAFNKFRVSAGAANGSAIAFNRVIQDAPFGIIGVGNNIQQLAEQFSALRITTGSTGSALSIFFKSLFTGSNLLVLGISAATSALTAYQLGIFDSKEETVESISETERFNQSLDNLVNSLNAVDSARLSANKSAQDELVELELLNSVLNDTSKSESERIRAYNLMLEKYPKIIGNITREKALVDGLGDGYNLIVNAIFERAKAIAIEDKIVEIAKEKIDLLQKEQTEIKFQSDLIKRRTDLENKEAEARRKINAKDTKQADRNQALRDFSDAQAALKKLKVESETFSIVAGNTNNAIIKNANSVDKLKESYQTLDFGLIATIDPLPDGEENIKRTVENLSLLNDSLEILRKQQENFFGEDSAKFFRSFDPKAIIGPIQGASMIYTKNLEAMREQLSLFSESLNQVGLTSDQVFRAIALGSAEGFNSLNEFILKLAQTQEFFNEATSILEQGIENTLGDVAFSIGKALGEGGNALEAGGAALLGGIAATLNQLGQLAIATGVTLEAIKTALETLRPEVAIAAGIALVGLAGFVSSQANKLSGNFGGGGGAQSGGSGSTFTNRREFGGPVSKGRAYIVGERRPELFVPNTNGIIVPQVPSMDYSGASVSSGMYGVEVLLKGPDDLLFFVEQAQIRRNIR